MEYFTFGMREMRVTQNYNGTRSHKPHWYKSKNYCDYPIDLAGNDSGKSWYFATVDMKVVAIKGIGNSMTNTIWLVATEKCNTPSGVMTPFIALTHWNDNDPHIAKLKVGSIVKAGEPICEEGTDGATANHLHMVCGNADKGCGNGLIQNSNGSWVSNGYCMKPEEVMFIDRGFTTQELWGGCLVWKDKPQVKYYPKTSYSGYSLVDGLKSVGINSSYLNRSKIAQKNGINGYRGTASQNNQLLNLLKQGKLIQA